MRQRIVVWGSNDKDEKVLIASRLLERENKVETTVFPADSVTEEFVNTMMNAWREGNDISFSEPNESLVKDLSITETFLPDGVKVDRPDLITRAQTEWNFVVMSVKLSDVYYRELDEIKDRVAQLEGFDSSAWEELKGFWGKVQDQIRESNLIKEHASEIRKHTNQLFSKLKELRKKMDTEFKSVSENNKQRFEQMIDSVDERVNQGLGLQPLFEELKDMQKKLRDTSMTREHRNKVWNRIDAAFKSIKSKRFGDRPQAKSAVGRLQRRYEGLVNAIQKMENSIKRDEKDLEFQDRKVMQSMGQLEMEMRKAKIKMIEERVKSKRLKLDEMHKTREELSSRIEKEKRRDEQRAEEAKKAAVREELKEQVASKIEEQKQVLEEKKEELEKAAEAIAEGKGKSKKEEKKEDAAKEEKPKEDPKEEPEATSSQSNEQKDSLGQAIASTLGESLVDVMDSVRAVAEVVSDRIEEKVEEILHKKSEEEEE